MGEVGAVDDHQHVGPRRDHRVGGFADAAQDGRQLGGDGGEADDRQIAERKQAGHALTRHMRSADGGKSDAPLRALAQRGDQRGAEPVAGFFARHQEDVRHGSG